MGCYVARRVWEFVLWLLACCLGLGVVFGLLFGFVRFVVLVLLVSFCILGFVICLVLLVLCFIDLVFLVLQVHLFMVWFWWFCALFVCVSL